MQVLRLFLLRPCFTKELGYFRGGLELRQTHQHETVTLGAFSADSSALGISRRRFFRDTWDLLVIEIYLSIARCYDGKRAGLGIGGASGARLRAEISARADSSRSFPVPPVVPHHHSKHTDRAPSQMKTRR